jgi:hypothetical protein
MQQTKLQNTEKSKQYIETISSTKTSLITSLHSFSLTNLMLWTIGKQGINRNENHVNNSGLYQMG